MKKISYNMLAVMLLVMLSFGITEARKLPAGTYLTSAKINVIEDRPEDAVAMLDSLFLFYGPHAQGLELMAQILVDFDVIRAGYFMNDGLHNPFGIISIRPHADWRKAHNRTAFGPPRVMLKTRQWCEISPDTMTPAESKCP